MTGAGRVLVATLVAGWLADVLARTDADVEAGIEAFEAGDHDEALAAYDRAVERLGERAEISFDRGLALLAKGDTDSARTAFERASEADDVEIRASAFYELGNLAFDAETWDEAIGHYTTCLQARPDHADAKWNLELAMQRKQDDEKEDEDEDDEEDEDENDTESGESGGEQSGETGQPPDEGGSTGGEDDQEQPDQGETGQPPEPDGGSGGEQDEQDEQDENEPEEPPPAQPQPLDEVDIDKALEQLDEQDDFQLGQPLGRFPRPKKDW